MKKLIFACIIITSLFAGCSDSASEKTTKTSTPSATAPSTLKTTAVIPTTEAEPYKIVSSSYELKEQNIDWWLFSYIVTVQDNTDHVLVVNLVVQFFDSDNYEIGSEYLQGISIAPGKPTVLTGVVKVDPNLAVDISGMTVGFN